MPLNHLRKFAYAFIGSATARALHEADMAKAEDYANSLAQLKKLIPETEKSEADSESPIFLFSAGWRSGSTLLQRIICSSDEVLIWGEIYDRCNIIQTLAKSALPFNDNWPNPNYIKQPQNLSELSGNWLANLYPPVSSLKTSYQHFLLELLCEPAKSLGAKRWGMKEVRFGLQEALFLHWLFPNAKFLFIHRDLKSAYTSYKKFSPAMNWYRSWPNQTAFTAYSFAKHRAQLLLQFESAAKLTGGLIIDYQKLTSGDYDFDQLDNYCELKVDRNVISNKVGSGAQKATKSASRKISSLEELLLSRGDAKGRKT